MDALFDNETFRLGFLLGAISSEVIYNNTETVKWLHHNVNPLLRHRCPIKLTEENINLIFKSWVWGDIEIKQVEPDIYKVYNDNEPVIKVRIIREDGCEWFKVLKDYTDDDIDSDDDDDDL
jgi:hypothetical protein